MEKERRTKALLLSTLVVVVATLSIAFAAMSRTLSINGIGKMDTASWSVYFDNLSNATTVRGAEEVGKPNINTDDRGILENIKVRLSNPKDEISYTVDIVNDGTIDAEITMIKDIELTDVQKKIFEFKVTYTGTPDILKNGDLLPAGKTKNITINIRFKDDITEADLPKESQTINLSYQITYTQYDGKIPVGPNTGGEVTTPGNSILASEDFEVIGGSDYPEELPFLGGTLARGLVESIDFLNSNIVPGEYASVAWDASQDKDGSVMAWYTDSDNNELYEVYIGGNGKVIAPENSSALLSCYFSLTEINFNGNFDTSNVKDASFMIWANTSLESLDLSGFNTENIENMMYMLAYNSSLTSINLSSFNTSNVTDMSYMFSSCEALETLDLSNFNTSNVTTMHAMFDYTKSLSNLNLSNFVLAEDISNFFDEANNSGNVTVDLRNADFSKVTSYSSIFSKIDGTKYTIIVSDVAKAKATTVFSPANVVTPSEL